MTKTTYADIDEPLPPGASDETIERLARDMGMTHNERPSTDMVEDQGKETELATQVEANDEPQEEKKASSMSRGAKPAKTTRVTLDLPDYVAKRLKRKALDEDSSVRFLILRAINTSRSLRISVDDADMIEDRRRNKKAKR